jgi:serine/threonine protein kinase
MPDDPSAPQPKPTNYQRSTGDNHLRWQPPTLEDMQAMLPQYQFECLLGRGGMGAVYKARQLSLQRSVAIKVLPGDLIDDLDANFAERFKNEARTMAKMNHVGIVKVYDFGETQVGLLYIVMEFIDGTDVAQMIRAQGKLTQDHAMAITAHVGDALAYAHKNGVIHRDIKPANILINQEGTVKVADFGLAKMNDSSQRGLTKTNTAMGTPDFVAPEALSPGTVVDGRADLYAMGVMLYQMLTGEIPRGMWSMPSIKVGSDPRYDAVILKAMQTDRELRYQDATEIRRDLDVIMTQPVLKEEPKPAAAPAQQPVANRPSGAQPQAGPHGSRPMPQGQSRPPPAPPVKKKSNDTLIYLVAMVVIGGLAGLFMLSGGKQPAKPTPDVTADDAGQTNRTMLSANASPPTVTGPVNLIALVDAKRDAIKSEWEVRGRELVLKRTQGPQLLAFRHTPPEEYDFEIEFTLKEGIQEASQIIPLQGKSILWKMGLGNSNPTQFGFGPVLNGVNMDVPTRKEAMVKRPRLLSGQRYRSLVEVRKSSLRALIDGREVLKWSGDFKRLGGVADYAMPDPKRLGVGGWNGGIIFHKAEVRAPGSVPVLDTTPPRTAPGVAPAAGSAWRPVFTEAMKKSPGVTELPDGWMRVQKTYLNAPSGKDMAIRSRMRFTGGTYVWPIRFRDASRNGLMHYGLSITREGKFLLFRRVMNGSKSTSDEKSLMEVKAPRPFAEGTEFDLEVSAQGDRLQVKLDGATIIDVRDTFHQGVRTQFGGDTATVEFKNLEWRDLSHEAVKSPASMPALPASAPAITATGGMDLAARQKSLAAPLAPGAIDVLSKVELKSDDTFAWTKSNIGVELKPRKDPGPYKSCLNFPVVPAPDFVIETWFTNSMDGASDVGLTVPVGDQSRTTCWLWPRDGGWAGFGKVDGKDPQEPMIEPGCSNSFPLVPGELTFMRVEVRRTPGKVDLRFMVNGRLMGAYRGPTSRLSTSSAWLISRDPEDASIGGRAVTFHRVTVLPLGLAAEKKPVMPTAAIPADPRLAQLEASFKARYETDAQKSFLAAVAALNQSYLVNGIARARAAAQATDEIAALDAEKAAIEKGAGVPAEDAADVPESLKALRSTYRTALAKLETDRTKAAAPLYEIYLKALDAYVIELTRVDKIKEAQEVQALRERIATQK